MKVTDKYVFFWKDKIAQWNMQSFKDNEGTEYCCAEQYMMAKKALLFDDKEIYLKIINTNSPSEHQKLGREIKNFNEFIWNEYKEKIVYEGNILKFSQNENLKEILFSTKDKILVEASPYDRIWGIGLGKKDPDIEDQSKWKGLNLLGKVLMKVRNDLYIEENMISVK